MNDPRSKVSMLLEDMEKGECTASDELLPLVYDELRSLAGKLMAKEPKGHTLQPTALVHEAYLRLIGNQEVRWENRRHFFGAAARSMRRILVERARRVGRLKRGSDRRRVSLSVADLFSPEPTEDLLALDEALTQLEAIDARKAEVVMLRFFGGLTIEETAKSIDLSPTVVKEEWSFARAWLYQQLSAGS